MTSNPNPTVHRRRLGAELRQLREEAGMTCEDVGERLECSASKISRIETGRRGASMDDVRDLLNVYKVSDEERRDALLTLAREARRKGWWQAYTDVIGMSNAAYIGLEAEAESARDLAPMFVPELLQTEKYARSAIETMQQEGTSANEIERRTAVRLARQLVLSDEAPLRLWALTDETVLHRQVGGAEIMREQLHYLTEVTGLPHVTLQVVPFGAGAYPGLIGPFTVLHPSEANDPAVAFATGPFGHNVMEREGEIKRLTQVFDRACKLALSPDDSAALVAKLANEL